MSGLNLDALAFCILWVLLAAAGFLLSGWTAGLILSGGVFLMITAGSALIYSTSGSIVAERWLRWTILLVATAALLSYLDFNP